MPESEHSPTATTSDRLLLAALLVCVSVAASYVAIMAGGERVFPSPINALIFTTLGTTILGILISRARDQIIRHIDRAYVRRAEQSVYAAGEITRDLTSRAQRVVASVPVAVGLDPGVVEIGSRIADRLRDR